MQCSKTVGYSKAFFAVMAYEFQVGDLRKMIHGAREKVAVITGGIGEIANMFVLKHRNVLSLSTAGLFLRKRCRSRFCHSDIAYLGEQMRSGASS